MSNTDRQRTAATDIILTTTPHAGHPHTILGIVVGTGISANPLEAARRAHIALQHDAHRLGADAIVAVTTAIATDPETSWRGIQHVVVLHGTTVLLPWPAGHDDPTRNADPLP